MPSLDSAEAQPFVKILVIGDSGSGKTGGLISLLQAGYYIHVIDFDNGLTFVANWCRKHRPELLRNIDFVYLRDQYRYDPIDRMMKFVSPAKAYHAATKLLDKWEDGSAPAEWGDKHILVIDSITNLGIAALNQAYTIKPRSSSGNKPDGQMIYGMAQEAVSGFISACLSPAFATNVIFMTHVAEQELGDGSVKAFPTTIGKALSRNLAKDFNDIFVVERNMGGKIQVRTVPTGKVDAKTSALDIGDKLDISDAYAKIFRAIRGETP